jgi:hypothetical protein
MVDLPTELGPKMQACSPQERRWVWAYLENGCQDASDAARKAGFSDPGKHSAAIRVRGHELRHRPRVLEALQEVARTHFSGLVLPAVLAAETMIANGKHPDHAKLVLAVLSAHGLGAQTKVDINVQGQIEHVNRTDAALASLEYMMSLEVPRSKLIETFGHSGLARYERMLSEKLRKQGNGRTSEHASFQQGKAKSLPAPAATDAAPTIDAEFSEVETTNG